MPQDQDDINGADAMKQAPTPGPLMVGDYAVRLEDHPLVKSGEVHRVTEMFRGGYLGFARPVGGEWNPSGWRKCDADGWMPWSGGENPVPGRHVNLRHRGLFDQDEGAYLSDDQHWTHGAGGMAEDIIAFRLAPTAPVEASGSEREEAFCEAYYQAHLDHAWSALREGKPYQVNADGAISLIQQAALDRSTVKAWQMSPRLREVHRRNPKEYAEVCAIIDDVRALSTTPARAEAQDEGAAGEAVAFAAGDVWKDEHNGCWIANIEEVGTGNNHVAAQAVSRDVDEAERRRDVMLAALTHPSPPPAADEDRVRIAVEALEYYAGPHALPNEGPWGASSEDYGRRAAEALRILKPNSTGWEDVKCWKCGVAFGLHLPFCKRPAVSDEDQ